MNFPSSTKLSIGYYVTAIIIAFTGLSTYTYELLNQRSEKNQEYISLFDTQITDQVFEDMGNKLSARIAEMEANPKLYDQFAYKSRFEELEKQIKEVDEKTLAVRQAINPLKPDEILTIARLTDTITNLKEDFKDLSTQVKLDQKSFKESMLREMQSSNNIFLAILVVLIPLVGNLIHSGYKNIKSKENG